MRPLSNSLLRAQRSSSAKPWVRVEALDRMAGIARLRFQRVHTGSEAEGPHALTIPTDGALIRARVDPTNSHNLYVQRVPNPSPTSDFTQWVSLGPASRDGDVALCSAGTDVLLFSVSSNRRTLYVRASADSGATFGQAIYVTTASSPVTWLAADLKPDGTALLLYALVNSGLYAIRRSNGSWGSPRIWSNSLSQINGVAVHYNGDWNVAVAGRDTTGRKSGVWSTVFGDGAAQPLIRGRHSSLSPRPSVSRASTSAPLSSTTRTSTGSSSSSRSPGHTIALSTPSPSPPPHISTTCGVSRQRSIWTRRTGWLSATRRATYGSRRPTACGRPPSTSRPWT